MKHHSVRRLLIAVVMVGLLLASSIVVNAQEDLPVLPASGDFATAPSSTYPYCVRLLRSNNNNKADTVLRGYFCYRTIAEENAYRDGANSGGWRTAGLLYRQTNFGTASGYLRYMGQRNCVAGTVRCPSSSVPLTRFSCWGEVSPIASAPIRENLIVAQ